MAVVVDVAVDPCGADHRAGGNADVLCGFENGLESEAEIAAAEEVEAEGAGVTVKSFVIANAVVTEDAVGANPVDEIVFDGVAVGMMADGAFAGVRGGIEVSLSWGDGDLLGRDDFRFCGGFGGWGG